jgi:hypothetical protein
MSKGSNAVAVDTRGLVACAMCRIKAIESDRPNLANPVFCLSMGHQLEEQHRLRVVDYSGKHHRYKEDKEANDKEMNECDAFSSAVQASNAALKK